MAALKPHRIPKSDLGHVRRIYDEVEGRDKRFELNLYITGTDEDNQERIQERVEATGDANSEDNA